jgi:hypothetical protein
MVGILRPRRSAPGTCAQIMTLAGRQPGDAGGQGHAGRRHYRRRHPWDGTWSPLPADPRAGISLTVQATTAAIVKIDSRADAPADSGLMPGLLHHPDPLASERLLCFSALSSPDPAMPVRAGSCRLAEAVEFPAKQIRVCGLDLQDRRSRCQLCFWSVATVMCGQLMPLKFSSTSWEYCSRRGSVSAWSVSSQNVAVTCAAFAFE